MSVEATISALSGVCSPATWKLLSRYIRANRMLCSTITLKSLTARETLDMHKSAPQHPVYPHPPHTSLPSPFVT